MADSEEEEKPLYLELCKKKADIQNLKRHKKTIAFLHNISSVKTEYKINLLKEDDETSNNKTVGHVIPLCITCKVNLNQLRTPVGINVDGIERTYQYYDKNERYCMATFPNQVVGDTTMLYCMPG